MSTNSGSPSIISCSSASPPLMRLRILLQRIAHAKVRRHNVPRLHPPKHPRNCPQVGQALLLLRRTRNPRASPAATQSAHVPAPPPESPAQSTCTPPDRPSGASCKTQTMSPTTHPALPPTPAASRPSAPASLAAPWLREASLRAAPAHPAPRQSSAPDSALPAPRRCTSSQHLALLRNAQLPCKAVQRLRKDRAMRRPATAPHRASASMEQPQRHAALPRHLMQRAVRLPNLPRGL